MLLEGITLSIVVLDGMLTMQTPTMQDVDEMPETLEKKSKRVSTSVSCKAIRDTSNANGYPSMY